MKEGTQSHVNTNELIAGQDKYHGICCITESHAYCYQSEEKIRQRFEIYRHIGVEMLRIDIGWRLFERDYEGQWDDSRIRSYLELVKESGFRIKMIVGTIMSPPDWFFRKHPEAQLVNEYGAFGKNTISYWYPGLKDLLAEKAALLFEYLKTIDIMDQIDYVVADFGPAGEPIYPPRWTQGEQAEYETFWCYDDNAQEDFRSRMRKKYGMIAAANSSWNTSYSNWDNVRVPKPGTRPGVFWEDVLVWYRDVKRRFILAQTDNFLDQVHRYTGGRVKVIVYIPGSDVREHEWGEAVKTGSGGMMVRIMCDSTFLIRIAAQKECCLQYTGCDNREEIEYLREYMDVNGFGDVPIWGENAGDYENAKDPVMLAQTVMSNRLCGLDYTHSHHIFQSDGITPSSLYPELKKAYSMLKQG